MGFLGLTLDRRSPGQRVEAALPDVPADPSLLPVATPWGQTGNLNAVLWQDVFGADRVPLNTRAAAMRLPAVARARNLIVSTICRSPLVALKGDTVLPPADQPAWAYRTDRPTSPQHRLGWTVDDLIFHGWSCWVRENAAPSSGGFPLSFTRVPRHEWKINDDGHVEVKRGPIWVERPDNEVTLIPGLHEGILSYGLDALADARTLYSIVRTRLLNPVPQIDLHQTGGTPLTPDEIDALIDRWATARRGGNGGVSYTNETIEARELGKAGDAQLMIEARNAASLDLARVVGVAASRIDATAPKASLNYETTTGRNQELVDYDLALYTLPIQARLSLDDVVPSGTRIALDLGDLTNPAPSPTGPSTQD